MSRRRVHPTPESELCETVRLALEQKGWLLPTNEAAVAAAEARLEETGSDAADPPPFERVAAGPPARTGQWQVMPPETAPVEDALARAAREGGPLTPAVEQAMQRDRAAAESKAKAGPHGPPRHGR